MALCSNGAVRLSSSSSLQNLCSAGKYSAAGATSCTSCPASTPYSRVGSTSSTACVSCSSGSCDSSYGAVMSSPCIDSTWTVWYDKSGVEGSHSCIKVNSTSLSWLAANAACSAVASGVHLLTSSQVRPTAAV